MSASVSSWGWISYSAYPGTEEFESGSRIPDLVIFLSTEISSFLLSSKSPGNRGSKHSINDRLGDLAADPWMIYLLI